MFPSDAEADSVGYLYGARRVVGPLLVSGHRRPTPSGAPIAKAGVLLGGGGVRRPRRRGAGGR